ncbi:MAG: MFS transporter [Chloroflexota bacterium]
MTGLTRPSPGKPPRLFYGYIVSGAAFLILFMTYGVYTIFGIFLTPILTDFGWSTATTSGAYSTAWIVVGVMGIFLGKFNDRFGPRVVLTAGGFLLGAGYLLLSRTTAVWHFYLLYAGVIGSGMGCIWVPLMSTIARWFTARRSIMTACVMAGSGIGTFTLAPITARIIAAYDWRTAYAVLGSAILVMVVSAAQVLRRDPSRKGLQPYGSDRPVSIKHRPVARAYTMREAMRTRQYWMFAGMVFSFGVCAYAVNVHIAPHAIRLGMSSTVAANFVSIIGGMTLVGRLFLGTLADKFSTRVAYYTGFALLTGSLLLVLYMQNAEALYLVSVIFGLAFSTGVVNPVMVAELFGLQSHGMLLGSTTVAYTLGGALGSYGAGQIFDIFGSYRVAFWATLGLSAVAILLNTLLRQTPRENTPL